MALPTVQRCGGCSVLVSRAPRWQNAASMGSGFGAGLLEAQAVEAAGQDRWGIVGGGGGRGGGGVGGGVCGWWWFFVLPRGGLKTQGCSSIRSKSGRRAG